MDDKQFEYFMTSTKHGVPPHKAMKWAKETKKLDDMANKIKEFIIKWNSGNEIQKPITQKEAEHLLLQFHVQKPLG